MAFRFFANETGRREQRSPSYTRNDGSWSKGFAGFLLTQNHQQGGRIELAAIESCRNGDEKLGAAAPKQAPHFVDAVERQMRERLVDNKEPVAFGPSHSHQQDQPGNYLLAPPWRGIADFGRRFAVESYSNHDSRLIDRLVVVLRSEERRVGKEGRSRW